MKPCPFCGSTSAVVAINESEINDDGDKEKGKTLFYTVVCSYTEGGCGASCGYRPSKKIAKASWDRRAKV